MASITAAAERVRREFGRLDVLIIQNAAISNTTKRPGQTIEAYAKTTRPSNVSFDEMRAVWDTNVFGVLAVYQATLPLLRATPGARRSGRHTPLSSNRRLREDRQYLRRL
jgi:NAD(P)-dependent dehydrogenase (short-subunit alcohol dehydrogenase family)